MDAVWQFLARVAGAKTIGLNRVRVAPGKLPTPPHSHGASEEIYYVLGGSGLVWQDEVVHEVEPGDCIVQRANEQEHTFVAGRDGLDYLVYGTNYPTELGWLPRSGAVRVGWPWVPGRTDDPWDLEAQAKHVEGIAHEEGAPEPSGVEPACHRGHRGHGGAALALRDDHIGRHAVRDEVAPPRHRLAGGVAAAHPAGDQDQRRQPVAVEAERVVQPRAEHRRRPAVVLRRAQHDDGVHRHALVLLADDQHHDQRDGVPDRRDEQQEPGGLTQVTERGAHEAARPG